MTPIVEYSGTTVVRFSQVCVHSARMVPVNLNHGETLFLHSHIQGTIAPRTRWTPGWSASRFHEGGHHGVHQAKSSVRYSANCMKSGFRIISNSFLTGYRHIACPILLTDNISNIILVLWCDHFQTEIGCPATTSRVGYHMNTSSQPPCAPPGVSAPPMMKLYPHLGYRQNNKKQTTAVLWLSSSRSARRTRHRRCHLTITPENGRKPTTWGGVLTCCLL